MLHRPHSVEVRRPLRFQRAEHDPAVLKDDGVQSHAEVEMADALDVGAVVVHHEELQGVRQPFRGPKGVAIAREDQLAARQRTGAHVENPIGEKFLPGFGRAEIARPVAAPVLGVNCCRVRRTILRVLT